jgi:hypothetical protein
MWRIVVPFLQFVVDCWLGLAVLALIAALLCGAAERTCGYRYTRGKSSVM